MALKQPPTRQDKKSQSYKYKKSEKATNIGYCYFRLFEEDKGARLVC